MATNSTFLTPELNDYLTSMFSSEDAFLRTLQVEAEQAGIPAIAIAPEQTSFLQVLLRLMGAASVLEIGSLAGYSAITMARALPPTGSMLCCELQPEWAAFIRRKAHEAGLGHVITVAAGPALDTIRALPDSVMFDAVFIDADKPNYIAYVDAVLPHLRSGGAIIGDNALAWGEVAKEHSTFEPENVGGIRAFNRYMVEHPQLQCTLVPLGDGMTIGIKR
jgi:predicted O-methyltransferase YrrM